MEETIPDFEELIRQVKTSLIEAENNERYSFKELFIKHPKGFYEKNIELFQRIGLNTMVKKSDSKLNEIKGIYIFFHENEPQYVGISRKLIRRLRNHFLGKSHFEASLVYLIARDKYDKEIEYYSGTRKDFPFEDYRINIQNEMINNWKIKIIPESNNHKIYLLEFALSCELKTKWNTFETH